MSMHAAATPWNLCGDILGPTSGMTLQGRGAHTPARQNPIVSHTSSRHQVSRRLATSTREAGAPVEVVCRVVNGHGLEAEAVRLVGNPEDETSPLIPVWPRGHGGGRPLARTVQLAIVIPVHVPHGDVSCLALAVLPQRARTSRARSVSGLACPLRRQPPHHPLKRPLILAEVPSRFPASKGRAFEIREELRFVYLEWRRHPNPSKILRLRELLGKREGGSSGQPLGAADTDTGAAHRCGGPFSGGVAAGSSMCGREESRSKGVARGHQLMGVACMQCFAVPSRGHHARLFASK